MYNKELLIRDSLPPLEPKEFNEFRTTLDVPATYKPDLRDFKIDAVDCFVNMSVNNLEGFEEFPNHDIITGCQQYVDHMIAKNGIKGLQIFEHDYHYYKKIHPNIEYVTLDTLSKDRPLLMAMPFPGYLGKHPSMDEIISLCNQKDIAVHLDCAWMSCAFDINFNFDQPCIKSFAMSFSKAYAMNWSKVGVRWTRERDQHDSISVLNDMKSVPWLNMYVAQKYMGQFEIDHCVKKYKEKYMDICKNLKLRPSNIIHACHSLDRKTLYGLKKLID